MELIPFFVIIAVVAVYLIISDIVKSYIRSKRIEETKRLVDIINRPEKIYQDIPFKVYSDDGYAYQSSKIK